MFIEQSASFISENPFSLVTQKEELEEGTKSGPEGNDGQQQNQLQQKEKTAREQEKAGEAVQEQKVVQSNGKQPLLFWVYGGNYPETVADGLMRRGNWQWCTEQDNIERCHFLWRPFNYGPEGFKRIDKRLVRSNNTFIYNHFEQLKGIVTKSGLVRSLKQYYYNNDMARQAGYSAFDSTATTYLLSSGVEDCEHLEFVQRYKDIARGFAPKEKIPMKHCVNNIWLVKPSNANQGRGIEIFSDLDELLYFVGSRPQFTCCVVQKYIERPMLFKGRKFDIRVWALFTYKNEMFFYKKGYVRTSSDDYSLQNGNNYVHLTNNCLQQHGDKYGVHEEGNTIGFEVLQEYLDNELAHYGLTVDEHFKPRMKDLIIDSFLAVKHQLNPSRRKHCFELFGYDFLIDEDFRIWMIEVNTNPYFGVPNNYIEKLLPKMMDDLLDIVVDPIYSPDVKPPNCSLPNDFELIYCEGNSAYSQPVNKRRPFNCSLYPVPALAQLTGPKAPKQDLKYLRQFKIPGANLSTVSYKKGPNPQQNSHRSHSLVQKQQNCHQSNQSNKANTRSKSINKNVNQLNMSLNASQKKQLLNIQSTPVTTSKQSQTLIQLHSKTPKNHSSFKHSRVSTTINSASVVIANTNKTERLTPNSKAGTTSMLYEIAERASSMKREISKQTGISRSITNNNNTTKESNSQGLNSHTSSSDQLHFQGIKDYSNVSSIKEDVSPQSFEKQFNRVILQIKKMAVKRCSRIQMQAFLFLYNLLQILMQLTKPNKHNYLYKEQYLTDLISLGFENDQIPSQISTFTIDLVQRMSQKFQICQMLIKNKPLQSIIQKFINSHQNEAIKQTILKLLLNVSCAKDLKIIQTQKIQQSPRTGGGVSGIQILKEQQFKRALDKGILLILVQNYQKYQDIIGDLDSVLTRYDLFQMIDQVKLIDSGKMKVMSNTIIKEQQSIDNRIYSDFGRDRINTEPPKSSPRLEEELTLRNHQLKPQDDLDKDSSLNLSFESKGRILSKTERAKDSDQMIISVVNKQQGIVQLPISQQINMEVLQLALKVVQKGEVLELLNQFQNVLVQQEQLVKNLLNSPQQQQVRTPRKLTAAEQIQQDFEIIKPAQQIQSKTVQQSLLSSPLKPKHQQQDNRRDSSDSQIKPQHSLIKLYEQSQLETPTKLIVHSSKQSKIISQEYHTPDKKQTQVKFFQKGDDQVISEEEEEKKKATNFLQAFLSKNADKNKDAVALQKINSNHINQRGSSKFLRNNNQSYQQDTSSSTQKKQVSSKYMPILKDKKLLPTGSFNQKMLQQHQQQIEEIYSPQVDKLVQQTFLKQTKTIQQQAQQQHLQNKSRVSSRASSKQIAQLNNRESIISDKSHHRDANTASKHRHSDIKKAYQDGGQQKSLKSQLKNSLIQKSSEKKRPPLHNNFTNSNQEDQNIKTYDSLVSSNNRSFIFLNPHHKQEPFDASGMQEGPINSAVPLQKRFPSSNNSAKATNGPSIPSNFFYPKNNGDNGEIMHSNGSQPHLEQLEEFSIVAKSFNSKKNSVKLTPSQQKDQQYLELVAYNQYSLTKAGVGQNVK